MNDTSIQRVPPKHLYPLADRKEINGVVILRLPVLQDLLVCWPRSAGNVGSQERMGHPVEPCDVPLHTVPVLGDPRATVLFRYHMMLPIVKHGSELHSGHLSGAASKGDLGIICTNPNCRMHRSGRYRTMMVVPHANQPEYRDM